MSSDDEDANTSDRDLFNDLYFDDDLTRQNLDDLPETEVDPVFGLIKDERERDRQGSQMGIRIEKAAKRMHLRTHVHTCIVRFNPKNNTSYFCTAGEGNYHKMCKLIAAVEAAKREAPKRVQLTSNLEEVMKAFNGTTEKKGENYMVKMGQHLEDLGVESTLIDQVHEKYMTALVRDTDFDVAAALKERMTKMLNDIISNGFASEIIIDSDDEDL